LSKIDLKVLRFALENGMQMPDAEIAAALRLKPSTVSYSIKKMRRERTIPRYRYRLNYHRLGFPAVAWVLLRFKSSLLGASSTDSIATESLDKLLSFPQVHVASFLTGPHDVALKLIDRDVVAINKFVLHISSELKDMLESPLVLFSTRMYKTHNVVLERTTPCAKLTAKDFEILSYKMLKPDAELREIAEKLSLHRNTVSNRWQMLWRENVLFKKTPVVNPVVYDELGIGLKAIVFLDVAADQLHNAVSALVKIPAVHELNQLLSGYDLMAIVRVKNVPGFFDLMKQIYAKPGVRKTVSHIILYSKPHSPNYLHEMSKAGMLPFKLACKKANEQRN